MKVLGDEEMVRWFQLARQTDPKAKLFLKRLRRTHSARRKHSRQGQVGEDGEVPEGEKSAH
jgi:GH35 family endo-1,4-beta-xylanase